MKSIIQFIQLLPAFWRLWRDWEYTPEDYRFILDQYTHVLYGITGGRMSKHFYRADTILRLAQDCWCEDCDRNMEDADDDT